MPIDLESELRDLGTEILRSNARITPDEVRGSVVATAVGDDVHPSTTDLELVGDRPFVSPFVGSARRLAALAMAAAALVGVFVLSGRTEIESTGTQATPSSSEDMSVQPEDGSTIDSGQVVAPGVLVLDPLPDGWSLGWASENSTMVSDDFAVRVYATESASAERDPAITLELIDVDGGMADIPADAEAVVVQGVAGSLYRRGDEQVVAFERAGYWFTLTGHRLDEEVLLAAAAHAVLDPGGFGAIIAEAGLPDGLIERAAGAGTGPGFVSRLALDQPSPSVSFGTADPLSGPRIWITSFADPGLYGVLRTLSSSVVETVVNGRPAAIVTDQRDPSYRGVIWADGARTYVLGSSGVEAASIVVLANSTRPATSEEWTSMIESIEPEPAFADLATGLPEPGTRIPTGVALFPTIDESLVRDIGRGSTYAYYTYFNAGVDEVGTTWSGAIGVGEKRSPELVIGISVSDPNQAETPSGVQFGPEPDLLESQSGSGLMVSTDIDGYSVALFGRSEDVGLMRKLIRTVHPEVADGVLVGYSLTMQLPGDVVELEPPVERSWTAGAFPRVHVHNGMFTVSVVPGPALSGAAMWGDFESIAVGDRVGFLYDDPETPYLTLSMPLDDGSTLVVDSVELSRTEFLAAAAEVTFVDEATWRDKYDPMLAIVPYTLDGEIATSEPGS